MPSQPVVRPAHAGDLAALQELARRTIDACYRPFLGDENVDGFIGSGASDEHLAHHLGQGHVHCLEADGAVAGLTVLDGPTVDLVMTDVRHHRRGLGTVLLARAEELLFARYEEIRLDSFTGNTAAFAFYEARGWRVSGYTEPDGGLPARAGFVKRRPA
ncbi:GNAT family N-acetyltransferase [Streptomyces sp. HNM0574]|uniref:GNAT family N-acetyltransferase n=1 Tax=Streptomyces sp. HNM0574 TaxID=2714954 RepID=UPI00146F763C|nr:GNAT family N-acetyltransferase [Streptomyces sp. HNM0574]NLU70506.1 GNAT family N-acetyltransferase [Streptomyces sp. HNM0574]